jgi:hypothetical protein
MWWLSANSQKNCSEIPSLRIFDCAPRALGIADGRSMNALNGWPWLNSNPIRRTNRHRLSIFHKFYLIGTFDLLSDCSLPRRSKSLDPNIFCQTSFFWSVQRSTLLSAGTFSNDRLDDLGKMHIVSRESLDMPIACCECSGDLAGKRRRRQRDESGLGVNQSGLD